MEARGGPPPRATRRPPAHRARRMRWPASDSNGAAEVAKTLDRPQQPHGARRGRCRSQERSKPKRSMKVDDHPVEGASL
jgi:hypothetical protein